MIREVTKKKSWAGSRDVMNWGMFCLRVRGGGCMTKGVTGGCPPSHPSECVCRCCVRPAVLWGGRCGVVVCYSSGVVYHLEYMR